MAGLTQRSSIPNVMAEQEHLPVFRMCFCLAIISKAAPTPSTTVAAHESLPTSTLSTPNPTTKDNYEQPLMDEHVSLKAYDRIVGMQKFVRGRKSPGRIRPISYRLRYASIIHGARTIFINIRLLDHLTLVLLPLFHLHGRTRAPLATTRVAGLPPLSSPSDAGTFDCPTLSV